MGKYYITEFKLQALQPNLSGKMSIKKLLTHMWQWSIWGQLKTECLWQGI